MDMNSAMRQYRLHLHNWRLLLMSFIYPAFVLAAALAGLHKTGAATPLTMLVLMGTVSSIAFFLASAQQEMLHRSLTFFLPGFRRSALINQAVTAFLVGAVTFVVTYLYSMTSGLDAQNFVHSWSYACLAMGLFGFVLSLVFRFPYSSYLPFIAFWVLFLVVKVWVKISGEAVASFLNHAGLISLSVGMILYLVGRDMARAGLHRKLIERPYISITELANPTKIEQFKQARAGSKKGHETGLRPMAGLITGAADRADRARVAGSSAKAGVWEAVYLLLSSSVPRSWIWLVLTTSLLLAGIVAAGLYDGKLAHGQDAVMVGFFPGLAFQLCYVPALLFYYIKNNPLGQLRSRQTVEKSGYLGALVILVSGMLSGFFIWLLFESINFVLASAAMENLDLSFGMPRIYNLFLPIIVMPFVLLVTILWRNKGSIMVSQQSGVLFFILVHGVFQFFGSEPVLWPVIGVTAILWLVLPFVWRRKVWKKDLI